MVRAPRLRQILRWAHLFEAGFLGLYIYSPLHADPLWTDIVRFGVFPLAGLSGVWMWQQARISRSLRDNRRPLAVPR